MEVALVCVRSDFQRNVRGQRRRQFEGPGALRAWQQVTTEFLQQRRATARRGYCQLENFGVGRAVIGGSDFESVGR